MALVPIDLTIDVPQAVIDAGGIDIFAEYFGWTSTISDPENPGQVINNPIAALDYSKSAIKAYVKQEFKKAYIQKMSNIDIQTRVNEAEALLTEAI